MLLAVAAVLVAVGLFAVTVGVLGKVAVRQPSPLAMADEGVVDEFRATLSKPLSERLAGGFAGTLANLVGRVTPSSRRTELERSLRHAGLEVSMPISVVMAGKAIGAALGGIVMLAVSALAGLTAPMMVVMAVVGSVGGFVVPDVLLRSRAAKRENAIRRTLPEALDLMAITVQAGVGLEQAVSIVSDRMPGPLAEEFARYLHEIQLGFSRREALQGLRDRTPCPELGTFVLSLLQADALGIAIGDVLKTQSSEMRLKRRAIARERAAKAPVRILFPLIFGVLPTLFVVILGPAGITIAENLGGK